MMANNKNIYILYFAVFFILQSCSTKDNLYNKYSNFPHKEEVEINDSCFYIVMHYRYGSLFAVISINPNNSETFNAKLVEFDSYSLNGHPLRINKSYSFHLNVDSLPDLSSLGPPDEALIGRSVESGYVEESDTLFLYSDYRFYFPKEDKMKWINIFDGINKSEKEALLWIERNITKISIKDNITYLMLTQKKRSFYDLETKSLDRWYIIPNYELTGLDPYIKSK